MEEIPVNNPKDSNSDILCLDFVTSNKGNDISLKQIPVINNGDFSFCIPDYYPRPPSEPTSIVICHCVRPSGRPSVRIPVCLSVPNDVIALTLEEFQLSASDLVGWCTVPWRRSLLKWPCLAKFCVFHPTLKFSMIGFFTRSEGRRHCCNSLRISGIRPEIWWDDAQYHGADRHIK